MRTLAEEAARVGYELEALDPGPTPGDGARWMVYAPPGQVFEPGLHCKACWDTAEVRRALATDTEPCDGTDCTAGCFD